VADLELSQVVAEDAIGGACRRLSFLFVLFLADVTQADELNDEA
jgi:hypothetical protein